MAENKQLLGGLYVQDQYDVNGDPESVSESFSSAQNSCLCGATTQCKSLYHRLGSAVDTWNKK